MSICLLRFTLHNFKHWMQFTEFVYFFVSVLFHFSNLRSLIALNAQGALNRNWIILNILDILTMKCNRIENCSKMKKDRKRKTSKSQHISWQPHLLISILSYQKSYSLLENWMEKISTVWCAYFFFIGLIIEPYDFPWILTWVYVCKFCMPSKMFDWKITLRTQQISLI